MARASIKAEKGDGSKPASARRGIQSIEVGFRILDTIRHAGRPLPLKELADTCQMTVPNVHYYLVSFQKVGLVHQQVDTGYYGLGPYALRLGLAALDRGRDSFAECPEFCWLELAAPVVAVVLLSHWGPPSSSRRTLAQNFSLTRESVRVGVCK